MMAVVVKYKTQGTKNVIQVHIGLGCWYKPQMYVF